MSLLSPQLEAFIAVAKYKTVHGAAEAIHFTQTAVTQRIRALERRLNTTLFSRSRRGMMLTPEGEALLRYCHAAQELEGEALAVIQGAGKESTIRLNITGPTSFMHSRVIPQCLATMKSFDNLLMDFHINDRESRVKTLRSGASDFAIIQQENLAAEMDYKNLHPEEYVLVCSTQWKHRKLRDIISKERIIDFDESDQITFSYLKQYELFDSAHPERHYVNRTEALALLISEGLGYGALTTEFSKPYVDRKELMILNRGRTYENQMVLAWYPRPEPAKYFAAVIEAVN